MAYKFDIEELLDKVEALLRSKLNTKIAAIEADKIELDPLLATDLAPIHDNAYYRQSWSDNILQRSPAIFYGVETIQARSGGETTAELVKLFVEVIYLDNGMDAKGGRRLMRYSRAIKEVIEENFSKVGGGKFAVEQIRPLNFPLDSDTSEEMKVGGVSVVTSIV